MPHLLVTARPTSPFIPRDACCTQPARPALPASPAQRAKLADLDANIHCSIIGTCLSTSELRKLIARHVPHLAHKAQQARIQALATQHAAAVEALQQLQHAQHATPEQLLAERDDKLALHTVRRDSTEQRFGVQQAHQDSLHTALRAARDELDTARGELRALEAALSDAADDSRTGAALPRLDGKRVLYVGGRPGCTATLARLVAAAGGALLVHDGGIEDRQGLLAAMLPGVDLVVFPIDRISHNAMHVAKQACARLDIACHPVRSASVASFVALIQRLAEPALAP